MTINLKVKEESRSTLQSTPFYKHTNKMCCYGEGSEVPEGFKKVHNSQTKTKNSSGRPQNRNLSQPVFEL
jgi:hypothetical protein